MALQATLLTPALVAKVDDNYATLVAGASVALQCSPKGPAVPDLAWLRAIVLEQPPSYEATIFADSRFAGLVVVWLRDKRIAWECVNNNHSAGFTAITGEINAYCVARYGVAWGVVENPAVRAAMRAAQPRFVEDGVTLRLEP